MARGRWINDALLRRSSLDAAALNCSSFDRRNRHKGEICDHPRGCRSITRARCGLSGQHEGYRPDDDGEGQGRRGDAAVTTKVKAAFAKDKDVSALKINVDTDKGVVKLSGKAKTKEEADKAVSITKGIEGVVSVTNNIQMAGK